MVSWFPSPPTASEIHIILSHFTEGLAGCGELEAPVPGHGLGPRAAVPLVGPSADPCRLDASSITKLRPAWKVLTGPGCPSGHRGGPGNPGFAHSSPRRDGSSAGGRREAQSPGSPSQTQTRSPWRGPDSLWGSSRARSESVPGHTPFGDRDGAQRERFGTRQALG